MKKLANFLLAFTALFIIAVDSNNSSKKRSFIFHDDIGISIRASIAKQRKLSTNNIMMNPVAEGSTSSAAPKPTARRGRTRSRQTERPMSREQREAEMEREFDRISKEKTSPRTSLREQLEEEEWLKFIDNDLFQDNPSP